MAAVLHAARERALELRNIRAFHDAVLEARLCTATVCSRMLSELSRRGLTASSPKAAEVLTRIWSEQVSDCPALSTSANR